MPRFGQRAHRRGHAVTALCAAALTALLGLLLPPPSAAAFELRGIALPERIKAVTGQELVLNGAGVRIEASLERYVVALYLTARRGTPRDILVDDGPKRLSLTLLRDMPSAHLTEAALDNIRENHTASELESLTAPLDEFAALMSQIGPARKGTSIGLDYVPSAGTSITVNGRALGKPVRGGDLYAALLRVWLGEDPLDRKLRGALLGR